MIDTSLRDIKPTQRQMYLDPRTKILLCITVSSILLSGSDIGLFRYIHICLAMVPLIFLIILKKLHIVAYYISMYLFALTIPELVFLYLPPSINLLFTGMVAMITKILPGMSMFCFLVLTTSVSEFVAAMDRLKISKKFTIPASIMFRFFPTIREEYSAISDAMKMRNVGSFRHPIQMLEYRLVPLLISLVSIGNNLSASALTRGLDAPIHRTNVCPIGFYWQDIIAILFCIIIIISFFVLTILGG